ncbi:MAG: DUF4976 domain-containing protein, partial [Hyphomicrobium sp.]|nr:DUF4976 domain-containing protein [Hyphomicrobium sp.]
PLVVWGPGRIPAATRVDQLVQHMDIGPTILEWAGIEVPAYMEAESLHKYFSGEKADGRPYVFTELGPDNVLEKIKFMTMIRSRAWKLVHFLGSEEGQLFDLRDDPHEERNLWLDPAVASEKQSLQDEIFRWRMESQIRSRDWMADFR